MYYLDSNDSQYHSLMGFFNFEEDILLKGSLIDGKFHNEFHFYCL
jgi:hypothetical protein